MPKATFLTGKERIFSENDIIVSKTDLKGRITYANKTFLDIAGFTEAELIGQPHSIIRHPAMPRCVFKVLWDTIEAGNEIFAYVINRSRNGDHYWVYAHVTPSFDVRGHLTGYHSSRRVPDRKIVDTHIIPLYEALRSEETRHASRKDGMIAGGQMITDLLAKQGVAYDEFICLLK